CIVENDFIGSDEPYVLVAAINLTTFPRSLEVTLYGPWSDVDAGEVHSTFKIPPNLPQPIVDVLKLVLVVRTPFWGLDNKTAAAIAKPEDVVFLAAVLERDDGKPEAARALVKGSLTATLASGLNLKRDVLVPKLIHDMDSALAIPAEAPDLGFWSPDDRIGGTLELKLRARDLSQAEAGTAQKQLLFRGDSGEYRVNFILAPQV
ncbi:MAG: hypothetical protein ACRD9L_16765, partial [Bryobacteraceae bacterium]